MDDNSKVCLAISAGVLVNILAIGLGITNTNIVYSQGVCLMANIISFAIFTIILVMIKSSTKE
jgi:hypothetical protein